MVARISEDSIDQETGSNGSHDLPMPGAAGLKFILRRRQGNRRRCTIGRKVLWAVKLREEALRAGLHLIRDFVVILRERGNDYSWLRSCAVPTSVGVRRCNKIYLALSHCLFAVAAIEPQLALDEESAQVG